MRIAFIGTGWVTGMHLAALAKLEDVQVAGIAGRNQERLKALCPPGGPKPYESYLAMLKQEKPDGVFLTLPPHLHGEVEEALADHVAAVLVEKPLANSLEPAQRAQAAFQRAGTLVSVAYQNRYRLGAQKARELFARSTDKPISVNGWWLGEMPGPAWWRNKQQSGGQFVEQCTHIVDLARFLAGEISEVQAFGAPGQGTDPAITVEDAITVNARFASGAIGNFTTGCFSSTESAKPGIGLVVASRSALVRFSGWGFQTTVQEGAHTETFDVEPDIFEVQARAFVAALRTGDRSGILCDYADGLASLKVGLAANQSMDERRSITVG